MRLTKAIKERIATKAIAAAGLYERRNKNEEAIAAWLEKARLDSIGGAMAEAKISKIDAEFRNSVKALSKKAQKLAKKDSLFEMNYNLRLNVCGQRHVMEYKDDKGQYQRRLSPYEYTIAADSPLGREWATLQNEQTDIGKAIEVMNLNIMAILSQATTDKKLIKIWPEAEAYLPKPEKKEILPPAVPIDLINGQIKALSEGAALSTVCEAGGVS